MTDKYALLGQYGHGYAGNPDIARLNAMMDYNPLAEPGEPDRSQIDPMPPWRSRTLAKASHPALSTIDPNAHEDVVRRFHIEPAIAAEKRRLDANRARLNEDRQKWWDENA